MEISNFPVVYVIWSDSVTPDTDNNGWVQLEDVIKQAQDGPALSHTVGFVLFDDEELLVLTSTLGLETEQVICPVFIPQHAIVSRSDVNYRTP